MRMILFVVLMLAGTGWAVWAILAEPPCIRYERQMVHRSGWMQPLYIGNVTTFIYHPARDYMADVCVEREKEVEVDL